MVLEQSIMENKFLHDDVANTNNKKIDGAFENISEEESDKEHQLSSEDDDEYLSDNDDIVIE